MPITSRTVTPRTVSPRTVSPQIFTRHSRRRMAERAITEQDIQDAAVDGIVIRQAGNRLEVRGRNGVAFCTDGSGGVVLTVLPRHARPIPSRRAGIGCNSHRRGSAGTRRASRRLGR